jgi:two-component system, LytTR family, response regulator
MMNYKIAIIDDEYDARRVLKKYIERYFPNFILVGEGESVKTGLELLQQNEIDILLLDIQMNDGTGFDLVDKFEGKIPKIVFTTAYDAYALKAFRYQAIDYILKPIDPELFQEAINRVLSTNTTNLFTENTNITSNSQFLSKMEKINSKIAIPTMEGLSYVEFDSILYFEADASYCKIHLTSKKTIIVSKPLKYFSDKLTLNEGFARTHKSYLVNSKYISHYSTESGNNVHLDGGVEIPVSRNQKEIIINFLQKKN